MAAAYAFLIAYSNQKTPDGQRRKLPRVELDAKVDLGEAWAELKSVSKGMVFGQQQPSVPGSKSSKNNNGVSGGENSASSLSDRGDQAKK